jgi:hypothetical protein
MLCIEFITPMNNQPKKTVCKKTFRKKVIINLKLKKKKKKLDIQYRPFTTSIFRTHFERSNKYIFLKKSQTAAINGSVDH